MANREWRVRTSLRNLVLQLRPLTEPSSGEQRSESARHLNDLLWQLEGGDPATLEALREVHGALVGAGPTPLANGALPAHELKAMVRDLRRAVEVGTLSAVAPPLSAPARRKLFDLTTLGPDRSAPEEETTFIGVRVEDQDGEPVVNERVLIEFSDGEVREGRTKSDGTLLISGLAPGGPAKITLPNSCTPGPAEPGEFEDLSYLELILRDDRNAPVPGAKYRVELPDGQLREGTLDAQGQAFLERIPEGECKVTFPDFDGAAWLAQTSPV
jgi:hypothetical protein